MGFFRYVFSDVESGLCVQYKAVLPSLHKIHQLGRYNELKAAFIVSLFGFKATCENFSPEGERDYIKSVREKAIQGIKGNMFDSTVNWLTAAYVAHLSSIDSLTISTLASLKSNFFLPTFQQFESGSLSQYLPPPFATLTIENRRNALMALGSWKPC